MARKKFPTCPQIPFKPIFSQIILRGVVRGKAGLEDILRADSIVVTLEPIDRVWV